MHTCLKTRGDRQPQAFFIPPTDRTRQLRLRPLTSLEINSFFLIKVGHYCCLLFLSAGKLISLGGTPNVSTL